MIFSNSKWIWCKTNHKKDNYAEFVADFNVKDCDNVILRIACDSVYCVQVNGSLAGFSGCADFPMHKFYDEIDISKLCKQSNEIKIIVWHLGQDTQTYINDTAGVIFEITSKGNVICQSDENTLSREVNEYANGLCKTITSQLGYSFCYDNTVMPSSYQPSVVVDKCMTFFKRNIKQLVLQNRTPVTVTKRNGSILIDFGQEKAGFVDLDIVSSAKQKILFAYGEHVADGCVRRIIGNRDFSFEFVAKQGENKYVNYLRRFAGRFIEIFAEQDITVNHVGIRNVVYPVTENKVIFDDQLLQQIYDVSINTLRRCMHEHYEDCPWREQALYANDARNQMLAELHTEYSPDFLCLQECSSNSRGASSYITTMVRNGYLEVAVTVNNKDGVNYTPLLYRADKFTLVDSGYHLYSDGANDKSKSITWGVFDDKATGARFAGMSTHMK